MAKVNQNKVIGGLIVAVITLIVVIVIVVLAKNIFPSNDKGTSDTGVGTNTYSYTTTTTTPTTTTTAGEGTTPSGTTSQSETSQSTDASVETKTMYVQDYVYMRTGPGTDNEIVVTLSRGLEVQVVKLEDQWYEIIWNGQTGYVYESYLGEAPPPAQSTTTTTTAAAEQPAA